MAWFFSIFISIFFIVYGGAHFYIYWRLIRPLNLTGVLLHSVRLVFLLLFLSFPLFHFFFRHQNGPLVAVINFIGSVWAGTLVYFLLAILGVGIFKLVSGMPQNPRIFSLAVTTIVLAVTVYGLIEAGNIGVTRLNVKISNLPKKLEGMTIAQISDVHMGLTVRGQRLEKIVKMVNELHPDLIVITGDLVDEQALHMEDMVKPLKELKCPYGIFAITGNHEYFAGIDKAIAFIESAGVTMLRNRWVTIAGGIQLAGRDDPTGARVTDEVIPPLKDILKGTDPSKPIILLYHTPVTTFEELQSLGVQLQLSGHTHKGQLWPFNYIVKMVYKTPYGEFISGNTTIYVSRGTGTWGPPMRVGARPEITLVTLSSRDKEN